MEMISVLVTLHVHRLKPAAFDHGVCGRTHHATQHNLDWHFSSAIQLDQYMSSSQPEADKTGFNILIRVNRVKLIHNKTC